MEQDNSRYGLCPICENIYSIASDEQIICWDCLIAIMQVEYGEPRWVMKKSKYIH